MKHATLTNDAVVTQLIQQRWLDVWKRLWHLARVNYQRGTAASQEAVCFAPRSCKPICEKGFKGLAFSLGFIQQQKQLYWEFVCINIRLTQYTDIHYYRDINMHNVKIAKNFGPRKMVAIDF